MLSPVTHRAAIGLLSSLKLQRFQGSMYTTRENEGCQFVGEIFLCNETSLFRIPGTLRTRRHSVELWSQSNEENG